MNPIWGQVAGVFIASLMLAFIGIWIWAWNKRHTSTFDELSRLPMEESSS